jgi:hypothetical protein
MRNCAIIHPLHLELETALLYIDGKAAGVIEVKKEGFPVVGIEDQGDDIHKQVKMCRQQYHKLCSRTNISVPPIRRNSSVTN